jgi:hypothetical protein
LNKSWYSHCQWVHLCLGYFLNKSTTYTKYEQGAWWQVDLGGAKNINQIIIYNIFPSLKKIL